MSNHQSQDPFGARATLKTDSGDYSYTVEVADSPAEKARGLMFRRSMPRHHGMIFLYDPPQRATMWMRNTVIPLDMIFITEEGTVLRIEAHTEPFSTTASRPRSLALRQSSKARSSGVVARITSTAPAPQAWESSI